MGDSSQDETCCLCHNSSADSGAGALGICAMIVPSGEQF
jgi:hypothetical protein